MILPESNIRTAVIGEQKKKSFTISNNKVVFDILRNKLYKDPIAAICREISSNSRDANRENKKADVQIEISIMESLQDFGVQGDLAISFKDNGIGISPERMDDVFLIYGESTKRDSNELTGGYGLGAKTPFAYSDTFVVKTVCETPHGKIKYVYIAAIDVTEKGKMFLFSEDITTENTGTEIIVPIKKQDRDTFEKKCIWYTGFWTILPKFINFANKIHPMKKIEMDGFELWKTENAYNTSAIILIDEIPYPTIIHSFEVENYILTYSFTNGIFELSGSREELQIKQENQKILYEKQENTKKFCIDYVKKIIDAEPTLEKAVSKYLLISGSIPHPIEENIIDNTIYNILQILCSRTSGGTTYVVNYNNVSFKDKLEFNIFNFYISSEHYFNYKNKTRKKDLFHMIGSNARGYNFSKLHYLDTTDKQVQRIFNVVNSETIEISAFFEERKGIFAQYLTKNIKAFKDTIVPHKIDEIEFYKKLASDDPKLQEKFDIITKKYEEDRKFELAILENVYEIKKLSEFKPLKYSETKKIEKKEFHRATFKKVDFNVDFNISLTTTSDHALTKDQMNDCIIIKVNSMQSNNYHNISEKQYTEIKLALLINKILKNKYKIICATQSYSILLKYGGISLEDLKKLLTEEHINEIKTISKWKLCNNNIVNIINSKEIILEDSDLLSIRLKKKYSISEIKQINNIFKSDYDGLHSINRILQQGTFSENNMTITFADEKETKKDVKSFTEKYPMLTLIKDDSVKSDNFSILNEYIKLMINGKK